MIRPFTCVCLMLAAGSGGYLYQTKHRAQVLDQDIARVMKATDVARERAGVLRAEWTLLNDPQRLKDLAGAHLALVTTAPTQFTSFADLDRRLPAIAPLPTPEPDPVIEIAPTASLVAPAAAPGATSMARAEPPRPEQARGAEFAHADASRPTPKPAVIATVGAPTAPLSLASHTVPVAPRAAPPAARSALASNRDTALPATAVNVNAAYGGVPSIPRVQPAPVVSTIVATGPRFPSYQAPAGIYQSPPTSTAEAIARIARGGPVDTSSPVVASALGMARSMMRAPQAVAPASAAQIYPLGSGG